MSATLLVFWLAVMGLLYYFMCYKPQHNQDEATNNDENYPELGSYVLTIEGLEGQVVSIQGDDVLIEVSRYGTRFVIKKKSILPPGSIQYKLYFR